MRLMELLLGGTASRFGGFWFFFPRRGMSDAEYVVTLWKRIEQVCCRVNRSAPSSGW